MQRTKTPKVIVTFSSLSDALAVEDSAKEHGFEGRIIPVPSELDAGCGFAWAADEEKHAEIERSLETYGLDHEGVFVLDMY